MNSQNNLDTQKQNDYDIILKFWIKGASYVGKTSISFQYNENTFTEDYLYTIGIDFKIKNLQLYNKKIKLQTWDIGGSERFKTITQSYYKNLSGIILVYDVNDK